MFKIDKGKHKCNNKSNNVTGNLINLRNRRLSMETIATAASAVIFALIAWQVIGAIWNIISIVLGIFKPEV